MGSLRPAPGRRIWHLAWHLRPWALAENGGR